MRPRITLPENHVILLKRIWFCLWPACFFLFLFFFKLSDDRRISLPGGQYVFFVLAIVSTALILQKIYKIFGDFVPRQFIPMILFLSVVLVSSAIFGLTPLSGIRLLSIITIASLPFVLLGFSARLMGYQQVMYPVVVVPIFCAFMACALEIFGSFTINGLVFDNHIFDQSTDRWAFWFNEANNLAWVLATGITTLLYQISISRSRLVGLLLCGILLPLLLYVFWKTNSRGVSVWVVLTLFLYFCLLGSRYFNKDQIKYIAWGVVAVCLMITCLVFFNLDTIVRFLRLDQADLTTGRMQIWLVILEELKNNPLLGYGFNATEMITAGLPQEGPWPVLKGPLNLYIGIAGEAGLLGLFGLAWLLGGAMWQCIKVVYSHFEEKDEVFYFAFFLFTILLGMMAQQNGEWQVLRVTPFNFLFFFLVSAAWSLANIDVALKGPT